MRGKKGWMRREGRRKEDGESRRNHRGGVSLVEEEVEDMKECIQLVKDGVSRAKSFFL